MAYKLSDIFTLTEHPLVDKAYKKSKEIIARNFECPSMIYFGLNFSEKELISIKFYFSFFCRLSKDDVSFFLPSTDDFFKYYHLWDETNYRDFDHTGCAFSVKFVAGASPIRGFHYRLRPVSESFSLVGEPKTLPFMCEEIATRPGINFEYQPEVKKKRCYYYLESEPHKLYISRRFGKSFARLARFCEFTESDDGCKVILMRFDQSETNLNRPNIFSSYAIDAIQAVNQITGMRNLFDGIYENDNICSTYYFDAKDNGKGALDQSGMNFHIDTLRRLLECRDVL